MPKIFQRLTDKKTKDIKVLANFVSIFCQENHQTVAKETFSKDTFVIKDGRVWQALGDTALVLCKECHKLLSHGIAKLTLCPYDPKPMCKKCETHCYAPGYREKIREVMKFSGIYLIKHGRVDLMMHYFF